MAEIRKTEFNNIGRINQGNGFKSRNYAYVMNRITEDTVEISSKKARKKITFKLPIFDQIRLFMLYFDAQKYMNLFMNKKFLQNSLEQHKEEITELFGKYGIEPKICMKNLKDSEEHFIATYNYAKNLTSEGHFNITDEERDTLLEAALLHDIGKALIPEEIFNKPGKLTDEERKIMDLHGELSYILLKDSGLSKDVLDVIRNHHHTEQTGNKVTEILSLCDETSALKEDRVYRKGFSDEKTTTILNEDADSGRLNFDVVRTGLDIMSTD